MFDLDNCVLLINYPYRDIYTEANDLDLRLCDLDLESRDLDLESRDLDLESRDLDLESRDLDLESRDLDLESCDLDLESCDLDLESRDLDLESSNLDLKPSKSALEARKWSDIIAFPFDFHRYIVGVGLAPTRFIAGNRKGCLYGILANVKWKCYKYTTKRLFFNIVIAEFPHENSPPPCPPHECGERNGVFPHECGGRNGVFPHECGGRIEDPFPNERIS